jgi:putative endopeptidase
LLEEAAKPTPDRTPAQQKIGDYYHACMDLPAVEKAGITPIQPQLDAIANIRTLADISRYVTQLNVGGMDHGALFGFGSNQDFENSQDVIAFAERGSLGLPDRDYYTKTDAKSLEIRDKYVEHMTKVFGMLGDTPSDAAAHAKQVMDIETDLAKSELTRVELRDPHKLVHKMTRGNFEAIDPSYDWSGFFSVMPIPASAQIVNVTEPAYYKELEHEYKTRSIDDWKSFLRWNLIRGNSDYLSASFVQTNFDFYGKYLRGTPEQQPRWRK